MNTDYRACYRTQRQIIASMYSGFTFSNYDLPFPTRYCIPYVTNGFQWRSLQ